MMKSFNQLLLAGLLLILVQSVNAGSRNMGIVPPATQEASSKEMAISMMAELNRHNLEGVLKHCAPNAQFYGWEPRGVDASGYKQAMMEIFAAFPDAKFTTLDIITEGDKVVVRHQLEGTHTGAAFKGVPTTNRKVVVAATVIFEFANGKATSVWLNADALGLMIQLGAPPVVIKNN